jgi:ABC-type branched-subunit amino acid transport system substrate-binding protein
MTQADVTDAQGSPRRISVRTRHGMRSRRLALPAIGALAIAGGVVATGCGASSSSGAQAGGKASGPYTVVIGKSLPLTGSLASFGKPLSNAENFAVAQANAAARQAGVHVSFKAVTADDQADPQAAVSAARQLAAAHPGCVAGTLDTESATAEMQSVFHARHIPMVSPAITSTLISRVQKDQPSLVNTVPTNDSVQGKVLAEVAAQTLGGARGKRIAVAGRNEETVNAFIDAFTAAWKAKGGIVLGPTRYDASQANFDSEAQKIVSGNPDGYFVYDFPDGFAKVGAALLRTGKFDASKLFVGDALAFDQIPSSIPLKALTGATGTRPGAPSSTAAAKGFAAKYPYSRFSYDAQSFDAAMLCALAGVAAHGNDSAQVAAEIARVSAPPGPKYTFLQLPAAIKALASGKDIDYEGVSGPINLDAHGNPQVGTYDVYHYVGRRLAVQRQIQGTAGG